MENRTYIIKVYIYLSFYLSLSCSIFKMLHTNKKGKIDFDIRQSWGHNLEGISCWKIMDYLPRLEEFWGSYLRKKKKQYR